MFNVATICESIRRHWLPIAVVVAISLCAGIGSSFVKKGEVSIAPVYTAESSLYVTVYGYQDGVETKDSYNYSLSESMVITEMRRIIVGDAVAGEVRREFGEDVTVSSPYWIDEKTNNNLIERFVFIDVSASDPEVALEAARLASELTIEKATEVLPIGKVVLSDAPYLKSGSGDKAADWGSDDFVEIGGDDTVVAGTSGINMKNVVIYVFVGVVLSVFGFAAYDILSRRIRSARDVERLIDVPVIAELKAGEEESYLAETVRVLSDRFSIKKLAVAGFCKADGADGIANVLTAADGLPQLVSVSLADCSGTVGEVADSDAVLLVVKYAAAKGSQIEKSLKLLKVADAPVLGAVFIPKN